MFVVGDADDVTEDETRKGPQDIAVPVTVNGRLRRIEEVDRYRFTAAASGLVTCDLVARRLGNDFNGVLEITADGKRIAEAVDTDGVDPVLTFAIEKGKTYTVAVRDVDHRGYRNFTYRLALSVGPRVVTAVPPAGNPGETRAVEFVGYGLATGKPMLERVTKQVTFPNDGTALMYRLETPHGTTLPYHFQLGKGEEGLEADGRKLTVPGAITGRIDNRGERDAYTFTGKKGDIWEVAAWARRIGSPVDAHLTALGPDGKPLAATENPDGPDPRLTLTLPADGEYTLVVADVSGKRRGRTRSTGW